MSCGNPRTTSRLVVTATVAATVLASAAVASGPVVADESSPNPAAPITGDGELAGVASSRPVRRLRDAHRLDRHVSGVGWLTRLNAGWAYSSGSAHRAWDVGLWLGTPVYAPRNSTVIGLNDGVANNRPGVNPGPNAPSNWVLLCSTVRGRQISSLWQHLSPGIPVHVGQKLSGPKMAPDGTAIAGTGTQFAFTGNTSNSTGPHLHVATMVGCAAPSGPGTTPQPRIAATTTSTSQTPSYGSRRSCGIDRSWTRRHSWLPTARGRILQQFSLFARSFATSQRARRQTPVSERSSNSSNGRSTTKTARAHQQSVPQEAGQAHGGLWRPLTTADTLAGDEVLDCSRS